MAIESLETPVYAPLNSSLNEVRLLHLPPGSEDEEFDCTLSIVSLNDEPQYEALSYVWGDDVKIKFPISLERNTVHITRNLRSALRGIRHLDCERILWIDALCINQKDHSEVDTQVAIMGDIYSKADRVLAYIGEEFDGCYRIMEIMDHVSENYKTHFDGPEDMVLRIHGIPVIRGGIPWDLVYQFFETPWITRVWTAQEHVLAKRILVYRSRLWIPDQTLRDFMDYLPAHDRNGCCEFRLEHSQYVDFRDEVFSQWRSFFGRPTPDMSILLPLEYYRMRKAGNPLDKIYGMLGIAGDIYKKRIRADYKISVEDLFTNVARVEGEVSGRLDFLSYCKSQALHLPSWVPDWTCYSQPRVCKLPEQLCFSRYSADGRRPSHSFVPEGRQLLVTFGVQLGTVYRQYNPRANSHLHMGSIAHMWEWTIALPVSESYYGGMQALEQAFWLTMCGGLDALSRPDEDAGDYSTFRLLRRGEYAEAMELWKQVVYGDEPDGDVGVLFGKLTYGRCFVVMENGAMGFAPRQCRRGDMVVALSGGSLVYVLRRVAYSGGPRKYTFVGDAYMDGYMDGKGFAGVDEGLDYLRAFTLV